MSFVKTENSEQIIRYEYRRNYRQRDQHVTMTFYRESNALEILDILIEHADYSTAADYLVVEDDLLLTKFVAYEHAGEYLLELQSRGVKLRDYPELAELADSINFDAYLIAKFTGSL